MRVNKPYKTNNNHKNNTDYENKGIDKSRFSEQDSKL